ncbi:putative amidophosphoribosyltransferase [Haloactinospora alba]|uniref:Putative amidophosphoribosyltransferase n=1 Tax=Haloactinospora alba TaxID=405555 RepID=A0A543NFC0_9ACTN|nr:phosphoribosyltransferase family protein [Haloactinospora alba]TQN30450.1 putative amidophosphoribosyltransferase [Haloactinospora alba]
MRFGVVAALADLVLGEPCAGCAGPGGPLCPGCAEALERRPWPCRPRPGCPPAWAAGPYAGRERSLLLAFKEHRRRGLAAPLGRRLAAAVSAGGGVRDAVVVPVPARSGAARRRGYDPALLLAEAACADLRCRTGTVRVVRALRYRRRPVDQAGLGRERRRANLAGAFTLRPEAVPSLRHRSVVVVDDVLTTGATLSEATRVLRRIEAAEVRAAVLTERR